MMILTKAQLEQYEKLTYEKGTVSSDIHRGGRVEVRGVICGNFAVHKRLANVEPLRFMKTYEITYIPNGQAMLASRHKLNYQQARTLAKLYQVLFPDPYLNPDVFRNFVFKYMETLTA